jgi:hypothetical protein
MKCWYEYMKVKKIRKTKLFTYALALMMVLIPLIAFSLTPVAYADTYPSPPALVTLTATGPTTATVSWTSSSGASYYYVGYSTTSTFTNVWNGGYTTAPTTSKNLTGLSPGTTYYAFVAALNSSWGYEGYTTNTYTVAYNGNGATGTPPADTGTYIAGATVTLPATQTSVADLVYSGYTFSGWSLIPTGPAISGTTFSMPAVDTTVYAQWASSDDTLGSLSLSTGTLNQTFTPDTLTYTANVSSAVTSDTVTALANSVYAQVYMNDNLETSLIMPLSLGDNSVAIQVYAQDGTNQTYNLTINRAASASTVPINIAAIAGVTAPATGATPVSTIAGNGQYSATATWSPTVTSTFAASTAYTATITIDSVTGYTYAGLASNFFTVAGATATFDAATGVVTAVFPATAAISSSPGGGGGGGGSVTVYTPVVQTEAATVVSSTSITLNGDITSDSGYNVTDYGFMWGTTASSLTNKQDVGTNNQSGAFTDTLTITPGTTYYFEAYATNSYGTADGAVLSYPTNMPAVQTEAATSITDSSAVLNGDITPGSSYAVTDYGFMWGTTASAITNKLDVGANNQSGAYMGTLNNLTTGTTYYFEAYATDSSGTADGAVMSFTAGVPTTTTPVFSDVPTSYWGYNAITSLATRGIVAGYPDGTFKPDNQITRAEFATILVKALGLSTTGTTGQFTDVTADAWYYGTVNAAASASLVSGMGDNLFAPNALITREQMAVMVAKALGTKAPVVNGTELSAFSDSSTVDSWAVSGMEEAVKAGIVSGMTADTLAPLADATRAQAAAMIYKMLAV